MNIFDKAKSLEELLQQFDEFVKKSQYAPTKLAYHKAGWFRGQSNESWSLLPGWLRDSIVESFKKDEHTQIQQQSLQDFIFLEHQRLKIFQVESSVFGTKGMDEKELYLLSQHHGLHTRLLDWTRNPRIALWFASRENKDADGNETDGVVYSMLPYQHISATSDRTSLADNYFKWIFNMKNILKWHQCNADSDELTAPFNGEIIAIELDQYSTRQASQRACFTLHLPDLRKKNSINQNPVPLDPEKNYFEPLSKLESSSKLSIPASLKTELRQYLRDHGLRAWDVFPDLDHLSSALNELKFDIPDHRMVCLPPLDFRDM